MMFERYFTPFRRRRVPPSNIPDLTIAEKRVRLTLEFSEELNLLVEQMASKLNITKSELLRRGIALISVVLEGKKQGQDLALIDKNDKVAVRIVGV